MLKSRKSQMPSQMFTYIFTLLVIGMLMFFGVKAIGYLIETFDDVTMVEAKKSIESAFEKIKSNYRSWQKKEFRVPDEVNRVCFLDKEYATEEGEDWYKNTGLCKKSSDDYAPLVCDAWGARDQNVVFTPIDAMKVGVDVQYVKVESPGYLCVNNTNGKVVVKLTGEGDAVKVSRP